MFFNLVKRDLLFFAQFSLPRCVCHPPPKRMIGALAIRSNRRTNKQKVNKLRPQISIVSTSDEARVVRLNSSAIPKTPKLKNSSQLSFSSILAGVAFVSGIIILVPASVSSLLAYYIAAFSCVIIGIVCLIYHCYHSEQIKKKEVAETDRVNPISSATGSRVDIVINNNNNNNNNNEPPKTAGKVLNVNGHKLKSQSSTESRLMTMNEMKKGSNADSSQTNLSCDVAISMESTPYASRVATPEMRVKTPYVREASVTSAKGPNPNQSISLTLPPNALVESLQSLAEESEETGKIGDRKMSIIEKDLSKQNVLSKSKDSAIHISTESSDSVQAESLKLPMVST